MTQVALPMASHDGSPFDAIKHLDPDGSEWWSARELMPLLGYTKWERFGDAIDRARAAAANVGDEPDRPFSRRRENVPGGGRRFDYRLSQLGVKLLATEIERRRAPYAIACRRCGTETQAVRASKKYCSACLVDHRKPVREQSRASRAHKLRQVGLTLADYDAMVTARQGRCDICQQVPRNQGGSLCVDHDHRTGRVRGLLCSPCNRAIGLLGDTATHLRQALTYLLSAESEAGDE